MKYDINSLIGFLFLFILTVLVKRSFNEYSEYRFEIFHLLFFIVGIALAKGRIVEIIQLVTEVFNRGDKKNLKDKEE